LAYPGLDSSFVKLQVLVPLRAQTPSQFGLVSSIFFLNSSGHLTWVTFTLSAYLISSDWLTQILPEQLTQTPPECLTRALPDHINAYPALYICIRLNYLTRFFSRSGIYLHGLTRPNYLTRSPPNQTSAYPTLHSLTWSNCLTDLFPIGLLPTQLYLATLPDFLARPGNTSLHPTTYPALPVTLPCQVPFNYPHLKTSSSVSHPDLGLLLDDNASR
jgi:hypothetical protein